MNIYKYIHIFRYISTYAYRYWCYLAVSVRALDRVVLCTLPWDECNAVVAHCFIHAKTQRLHPASENVKQRSHPACHMLCNLMCVNTFYTRSCSHATHAHTTREQTPLGMRTPLDARLFIDISTICEHTTSWQSSAWNPGKKPPAHLASEDHCVSTSCTNM